VTYNLGRKGKQWINNLALEAETAAILLRPGEQEYIRHQIAQNIKKLYKQQNQHPAQANKHTRNENRVINQIKEKLTKNKAMISKTDKGNSIIVLYQEDYKDKINKFIASNNFTVANSDVTKKLQRDVRNTMNECQQIIHKYDRWKYVNLNPTSPTIRGLLKVHKEGAPIRPIVNWKNAPAYKLAKMLVRNIHAHIPLPYTFNVKTQYN
jgi:small-conductance mechanosensitive channel